MLRRTIRFKASSPETPRYQLKLTLKWSKPPIWRRVVVRADMTLEDLHEVIQMAMGWTNSHMHQFIGGSGFKRVFYGRADPALGEMRGEMLDEQCHTVADLAPAAKRKFIYEYDFGDSWEHEVVVEKILPPDAAFKHPVCLAGAKACPPEDCGGVGGYSNLLEIMANPKHPEHEDLKDGIGGELTAAKFSLDEVNAMLKRLKA